MTKVKEAIKFIRENGARSVVAFVLTEGIFLLFSAAAGVVGVMISGWGPGIICAAGAFLLLNSIVLIDVVAAVFAKLQGSNSLEKIGSGHPDERQPSRRVE